MGRPNRLLSAEVCLWFVRAEQIRVVAYPSVVLSLSASQSDGDLSSHTVLDPLAAQAVSVGYSRPFRYLSPVIAIRVNALADIIVPLGAVIPFPPSVNLVVRPNPSDSSLPFTDDCDLTSYAFEGVNSVLARCGEPCLGDCLTLRLHFSHDAPQSCPPTLRCRRTRDSRSS